ncbi:hypothetical protein [Desulfatibacillum aliphaticivorans]|uniref:hypothetical protein n=1 Tax=Desulfatibacillum aliphaticivorans TaxID=218208 RepID=UPI00040E6D9D|nr:hypothetical protein [Desulfatibacillum aliphaticivorans]
MIKPFMKVSLFGSVISVLAIGLLLAAPVHARLESVDDKTLAEIRAQALMSFAIESRSVHTSDAAWFWQDDGYVDYDVFVVKLDEEVAISNLSMSRLSAGYYHDGDGYGWDIDMSGDDGVVLGADGYPLTFNGLRIEVAVDDADSANPNILFIRFGTDDISGRLRAADSGLLTFGGSIQTLSVDGHIESILAATADPNGHRIETAWAYIGGLLPILLNLNNVEYIDFGNTGDGIGASDFYLSFANLITDSRGETNANSAFNANESGATHIPGQGVWLHFQQTFVQALLNVKK